MRTLRRDGSQHDDRVVVLGSRVEIGRRAKRQRLATSRLEDSLDELRQRRAASEAREAERWANPLALLERTDDLMAGAEDSGSWRLALAKAFIAQALTLVEAEHPVTRAEFERLRAEVDGFAEEFARDIAVSF